MAWSPDILSGYPSRPDPDSCWGRGGPLAPPLPDSYEETAIPCGFPEARVGEPRREEQLGLTVDNSTQGMGHGADEALALRLPCFSKSGFCGDISLV